MSFALTNMIYTLGLLVGMLFLLEVGRRIGLWRMAVERERVLERSRARSWRYWDC